MIILTELLNIDNGFVIYSFAHYNGGKQVRAIHPK